MDAAYEAELAGPPADAGLRPSRTVDAGGRRAIHDHVSTRARRWHSTATAMTTTRRPRTRRRPRRRTARPWRTTRSGSRTTSMLHSVGVDIGSSGTQVAFSRLHLRRHRRGPHQPLRRGPPRDRLPVRRSRSRRTRTADHIDADALGEILDQAYADARRATRTTSTPASSSSPARRCAARNAEAIAGVLAERAGDLVCATAGPPHGGHARRLRLRRGRSRRTTTGSGSSTSTSAAARPSSRWSSAAGCWRTAALHVGGRLLVVDDGQAHRASSLPGRRTPDARATQSGSATHRARALAAVAEAMADALVRRPAPANRGRAADLTEPLGTSAGSTA